MAIGQIYVAPKKANEPEAAKPVAPVEPTPQPSANEQAPAPDANAASSKPDDLISRITQFAAEKNPAAKPPEAQDEAVFNDKELRAKIDAIADPAVRDQFIAMRKSMMTGLNGKFEELAALRKEVEAVKNSNINKKKFSADSVEELLNNPAFLQEAQTKIGQQANSPIAQDAALSDETKQYIQTLESKVKQIEESFTQKASAESQAAWNAQHEALAGRYKNYDRMKIDAVAKDLIEGRTQATPEYLYKAVYHDENIKAAYAKGIEEGQRLVQEKKQVTPIEGVPNAVRTDAITQDKNEGNLNFLQRIIATKLAAGASK